MPTCSTAPVWCSAVPKTVTSPRATDPAAGDAFFDRAGTLAARYGVRLAVEANPPVYTNYLTRTADAFALVKRLGNPGLAVNLDLSTILANGERLQGLRGRPCLGQPRAYQRAGPGTGPAAVPNTPNWPRMLHAVGYRGFVSIEMRRAPLERCAPRPLSEIAEVFA